jgi:hypothetical protein
MQNDEPKRLGLVKNLRLKGDLETPLMRVEFTFIDDRSGPVSVDVRSTLLVRWAKQVIALDEEGRLGQ